MWDCGISVQFCGWFRFCELLFLLSSFLNSIHRILCIRVFFPWHKLGVCELCVASYAVSAWHENCSELPLTLLWSKWKEYVCNIVISNYLTYGLTTATVQRIFQQTVEVVHDLTYRLSVFHMDIKLENTGKFFYYNMILVDQRCQFEASKPFQFAHPASFRILGLEAE